MSKFFSSLLVLVVVILVITGLNISGRGINSLTAEESKPVIGWQIENQQVSVFALGEEYQLTRQNISRAKNVVWQNICQQGTECCIYLKKIWTIFNILLLK